MTGLQRFAVRFCAVAIAACAWVPTVGASGPTANQGAAIGPEPAPVETEADAAPAESRETRITPRAGRSESAQGEVVPVRGTSAGKEWGMAANLVPLSVVVLVILGAAWAFRRWMPGASRPDDGLIRVVSRATVTPKHSIVLISVGDRFVLVGISGDRMTALNEMAEPAEVARLAARLAGGAGEFDALLGTETTRIEEALRAPPGSAPVGDQPAVPKTLGRMLRRLRALQRG